MCDLLCRSPTFTRHSVSGLTSLQAHQPLCYSATTLTGIHQAARYPHAVFLTSLVIVSSETSTLHLSMGCHFLWISEPRPHLLQRRRRRSTLVKQQTRSRVQRQIVGFVFFYSCGLNIMHSPSVSSNTTIALSPLFSTETSGPPPERRLFSKYRASSSWSTFGGRFSTSSVLAS